MALILHIDTSTATGSVCLAENRKHLASLSSTEQKDHASVIPVFIRRLMEENHISGRDVDAVAISAGPGSYTGLRVAASTAKGLCYAWDKPLIAVSTLQMMAAGLKENMSPPASAYWLCPMIDARRDEVFTALYNEELQEEEAPHALVVSSDAFPSRLDKRLVFFFGDGSKKFQILTSHPAARFPAYLPDACHLIGLAADAFEKKRFADLAYFEPFYVKPFYSTSPAKPSNGLAKLNYDRL